MHRPSSKTYHPMSTLSRRSMICGTLLGTVGTLASTRWAMASMPSEKLPIYKTLKFGMIGVEGSVEDKFRAAKAAGFEGVEIDCPGADVEAIRAAIAKTGLPVDGSVCSTHWNIRHTSADPAVRAQALEDLKTAIRQTHAV